MTEHKHAEVLRAIADGKEVEWFGGGSMWIKSESIINPISYPHYQWRIKPEKQVLRYRLAKMKSKEDGCAWIEITYDEGFALKKEKDNSFMEWIDDWQEVEVE